MPLPGTPHPTSTTSHFPPAAAANCRRAPTVETARLNEGVARRSNVLVVPDVNGIGVAR